jgi:outer membrane immunogenic protein
MKKLLLAGVAFVSLGTAASAADLAARTYTKAAPMVSPGYNWSGFYVGAMGGYAWASDGNGGFGGGTVGYNWQAPSSPYVFGLEVDAVGSSLKSSQTALAGGIPFTAEDKIYAFGSVTGRVGYAVNAALFYVKGGYAWADNKVSVSALGVSVSDSHVHSGYTVGGGLEYMFAPNWSAKIEYMYANYSSENYTLAGTTLASGTIDFNTIKAGINYHFK